MQKWHRSTVAGWLSVIVLVSVLVPAALASTPPLGAFRPDSYWNVPLPADAPVHPNSAQMISFLEADNSNNGCLHLAGAGSNRWGTPVYYAKDGDPAFDVKTVKYKIPPEFANLRIPAAAASGDNSDAEMVIYDRGRNTVALLSKALYDAGSNTWTVGGGTIHYLDSNGLSANVAGGDPRNFSTFRGQNGYMHAVRYEEVAAGAVNHVMRIAVNTAKAGEWLWPVNGTDGTSTHADAPPQGTRLRIKPGIDLSQFNLHPEARVIARGLQTHGAMVTDSSGGATVLKLEDTVRGGRGQLWGLSYDALCSIPMDAFEIIAPTYRPTPGATVTEPQPDAPGTEPQPDAPVTQPQPTTSPSPTDTRSSGAFDDLQGTVHAQDIELLGAAGLVSGCAPRAFCPRAEVTRGQLATMLASALTLGPASEPFADVPAGGAHAGSIGALAAKGIISGCAPGRFCPDAPITRAQFATLLAKAYELADRPVDGFDDVDADDVHAPAIGAIAAAEITDGCAPARFCPSRSLPRDEMAALLARTVRVIND